MNCTTSIIALVALSIGAAAGPWSEPNLGGRWARLEVTTALSKVPMIGDITSETTAVVIVDLRREGETLQGRQQVCSIDNESLGGRVRARFGPAFLRAVSDSESTGLIERNGDAIRYRESRPLRVHGAELEDLETEALPTSADDARLRDADADGQPGLTVQVTGFVDGEVYVVQRDASELSGTVHANGRQISGLVTWRAEQVVVGASRSMLASNPNNRPHPEPARSFFRMVRIPAKASCDHVLARRRQLFGR